MNPISRERLFGYAHAFDDSSVRLLVWVIVGILVAAIVGIGGVAVSGRAGAEFRRELVKRYLAWVVMVPLVAIPILAGAFWAIGLVAILSLLCYREFARATGLFRDKAMTVTVVVGVLATAFATLDHWYGLFAAIPALAFVVILAVAILGDQPKGYIQRVGLTGLAFLLFGVCLGHLAYFANDTHYRGLMMLILVCVGMNDVFAFCVGKAVGGAKILPRTSPNKTISGSVGAVVLTAGLFYALGSEVFRGTVLGSPVHLVVMGVMLSVAGQLGDLTISSIKRDVGIKDMGVIIPGHGGVLDRCNSLLIAAPAMFHYLGYFLGVGLDQPVRIFTSR